jgi:hypothetical protein
MRDHSALSPRSPFWALSSTRSERPASSAKSKPEPSSASGYRYSESVRTVPIHAVFVLDSPRASSVTNAIDVTATGNFHEKTGAA